MLGFAERGDAVPCLTDIAAEVVRALRAHQGSGPYCLGGWCARGVLAYEVASQLHAQGQEVDLVIILDGWNPVRFKQYLKQHWWRFNLSKLIYGLAELLRLRGRDLRRYLWECLVNLIQRALPHNLIPSAFRRPTDEVILEKSVLDYVSPPYAGNVVLLQTDHVRPHKRDHRSGWEELVQGDFAVYDIPGTAETLLKQDVKGIAACIDAGLLRAQKLARRRKIMV
jgi:thioesterase domain-containing protein